MTRSQRKGKRVEYVIRNLFRKLGKCERVPCSGNARVLKGDLVFVYKGKEYKVEVKARKEFKQLQKWLEKVDFLVLKPDKKTPLVVMEFSLFEEFLSRR